MTRPNTQANGREEETGEGKKNASDKILEDVSHYHCLVASLAGLEAAATYLRSHGITASQAGMLD